MHILNLRLPRNTSRRDGGTFLGDFDVEVVPGLVIFGFNAVEKHGTVYLNPMRVYDGLYADNKTKRYKDLMDLSEKVETEIIDALLAMGGDSKK